LEAKTDASPAPATGNLSPAKKVTEGSFHSDFQFSSAMGGVGSGTITDWRRSQNLLGCPTVQHVRVRADRTNPTDGSGESISRMRGRCQYFSGRLANSGPALVF